MRDARAWSEMWYYPMHPVLATGLYGKRVPRVPSNKSKSTTLPTVGSYRMYLIVDLPLSPTAPSGRVPLTTITSDAFCRQITKSEIDEYLRFKSLCSFSSKVLLIRQTPNRHTCSPSRHERSSQHEVLVHPPFCSSEH